MAARDNAKQQLAAKNAKPRDLNRVMGQTDAQRIYEGQEGTAKASDNSMIERGQDGVVYRYSPKFDYTTIERPDGTSSAPMKGDQRPSNSMDAYIDKVTGMAGMNGGNVPTPSPRPDDSEGVNDNALPMTGTENHPGKVADDTIAAAPTDDTGSMSSGAGGLLGLLGLGGLGVGGAALIKYLTSNPSAAAAVVGAQNQAIQSGANDPYPAQQLEKEDRLPLAPPAKQLPAPEPVEQKSNVDQSIDAIDGFDQERLGPPPKQLTDADAPYTPRNPERKVAPAQDVYGRDIPMSDNGWPQGTESWAEEPKGGVPQEIVGQIKAAMDQGDARRAIQIMRENGIAIDDNIVRQLSQASNTAKSLRARAAQTVEPAVRSAVRP